MTAVLQLDAVTRVHGEGETAVQALRGVSFAAHAGELVAIMGPSGSGKSTLLTLAGGLDSPTSGTVSVEGTDLASLGANGRARMRRTSIGYVFQDFNLIPALTAVENVALPRELDGESSRAARKLARVALEEVGIGELADRFPDNMSRRPAAAGRDRPCRRRRASADPGRRADRRPRHRDRRGDPAAAPRPLRRRRGRRPGHPRGAARGLGGPGGVPARRRRRRRDGRRPGRGAGGRGRHPMSSPERLAAAAPAGPPRRAAAPRPRSVLVLVMIALPVLAVTAADVLIQTVERLRRRVGGPADGCGAGPGHGHRRRRRRASSRRTRTTCCAVTDGDGESPRCRPPSRSRRCSTGRRCSRSGAAQAEVRTDEGPDPGRGDRGGPPRPAHPRAVRPQLGPAAALGGRGRGQPVRARQGLRAWATPWSSPRTTRPPTRRSSGSPSRRPCATFPVAAGPLGAFGVDVGQQPLVAGRRRPGLVGDGAPAQRHRRHRRLAGGDRGPAAGLRVAHARCSRPAPTSATVAVLGLIVVMALIEVVLLAGPAFAVSARKQQRSLALMAATGGTPKQSRRVIVASAFVLGSVAAVGRGRARHRCRAAARSRCSSRGPDNWFGPFEVPWLHLARRGRLRACSARSWPPSCRPTSRPGRTSSRCWPGGAATGRRP